jgi:hypothetical protein
MTKKRPSDINLLARLVVEEAIGDLIIQEKEPPKEKNAAAVALGRLGGLKGGKARAEKLTEERRKEIATQAAQTRWTTKTK